MGWGQFERTKTHTASSITSLGAPPRPLLLASQAPRSALFGFIF